MAVIGAECSGKSTLAHGLGSRLPGRVVPEQLRIFVREQGRVPGPQEQRAVMERQMAAERTAVAAAREGWVVSDSGALMTAVYSLLYYDDDALLAPALRHHRQAYAATLWCGIDLPWVADTGYRDGPDHRRRGHAIIAELVAGQALAASIVTGDRAHRIRVAMRVVSGAGGPR